MNTPAKQQERGSAAIEFVGLAPVLLIALLGALQVFSVIYSMNAASQAARDAAREYSISDSLDAARAAAQASLPGAVTLVAVSPAGNAHGVTVAVDAPRIWPVGDLTIRRTVVMP